MISIHMAQFLRASNWSLLRLQVGVSRVTVVRGNNCDVIIAADCSTQIIHVPLEAGIVQAQHHPSQSYWL